MKKLRLFTPGPTMVPEDVMLEMARPLDHHRTGGYREMLKDVTEHLQYLFQTTTATPFVITGSGTAAGEAAIVSTCPPGKGHKALCVRNGKFGERWAEVCAAFDIDHVNYDLEWGYGADPKVIDEMMAKDSAIDTVTVVHSETCSSAVSDVKAIAEVTRKRNALLIVDGITAVGAIPLQNGRLGHRHLFYRVAKSADAAAGAGHRGGGGAGLGADRCRQSSLLLQQPEEIPASRWTPFDNPYTPNNQLVRGLQWVLHQIKDRGLEDIWQHTALLAKATRAAVVAMGLKVFAAHPVDSVTGIWVPEGVDEGKLRKAFRSQFGMQVAGAQDRIKGKVIRISHMGYMDAFDTLGVLGALELLLHKQGYKFTLGSGLAAAQKVFAEGM